jgi:two-component sensor histidine kinase
MFASVPHNPRLPVVAFALTLIGLLALLFTPIIARQRVDRLHAEIDDRVEPAREQILQASANAHEIQSYIYRLYFYPDASAPQPATISQYRTLVQNWRAEAENDQIITAGGAEAVRHWQTGKAQLNRWFDRYEHAGTSPFEQGPESAANNAKLFEDGIREFREARMAAEAHESDLRREVDTINRWQVRITVLLALICLLLALLFWRNLLSLRRSWMREQETRSRLEVAMQETNHRIKNNLQVVSSLLDMQMLDAEETIPKESLHDLVQQVKAVAAVHDFLSHEMRGSSVQGDRMLERLVQLVAQPAGLEIRLEAEAVGLEVKQATALALITNELLLNSGKHGATEALVCMRVEEGNKARLQVTDNGPGFPASFDPLRDSHIGIALVSTLTRHDLEGDVAFQTRNGALVEITFPLSSS